MKKGLFYLSMNLSLPFSFQFFTRLASVFAEEVGGFLVTTQSHIKQRSPSIFILRIHIRTVFDKQFNDFHATGKSRTMQRSLAFFTLRIHIRAFSQVLFDCFDVSPKGSIVNIPS